MNQTYRRERRVAAVGVEPALLRVEEAQIVLGLGRSSIYALLARGELKAIHVGRAVRIPRPELERFVSERIAERTGAA